MPEVIETVHGVLQLLLQPVDHGGPSPVGRRPGPATGKAPIGGVGSLQCLQFDLDELRLLQSKSHIGVHTRAEVLHGLGIVKGLALLVTALQILVQPFELLQLVLDRLHVLEELVEIDAASGGRCGAHLDDMVTVIRRGFLATEAREGSGEQVIHRQRSNRSWGFKAVRIRS